MPPETNGKRPGDFPAFPATDWEYDEDLLACVPAGGSNGMTYRQWLASQCLKGLLPSYCDPANNYGPPSVRRTVLVAEAVALADTLIAELDKPARAA